MVDRIYTRTSGRVVAYKRLAVGAGTKVQRNRETLSIVPMLTARTTTAARAVAGASRRHLATAVETPFKIAAVDNGQPTASVTLVVKAGPRFETTPGVAHVLKNFAFKVRSLFFSSFYILVVMPILVLQTTGRVQCEHFCTDDWDSHDWLVCWLGTFCRARQNVLH